MQKTAVRSNSTEDLKQDNTYRISHFCFDLGPGISLCGLYRPNWKFNFFFKDISFISNIFLSIPQNNIRDKLTPIDVSFSYRLVGENEVVGRKKRQAINLGTIPPILDKYIPSTVTVEVRRQQNYVFNYCQENL